MIFNIFPILKGQSVAKSFFENLAQENYTKASQYLVNANQKSAVEQELLSMKEQGVFITGFW